MGYDKPPTLITTNLMSATKDNNLTPPHGRGTAQKPYLKNRPLPLNLLMQGTAAQKRVVLHLFDFFRLQFLVARRHVTRRRLPFFARFGAFDNYGFPGHAL